MPPDGVIEPVDVSGDGVFGLLTGLPRDRPDQLRLDGLEERLDHRVVVAITLAAHGDQDVALSKLGLIVDRAILATAIAVMNQTGRGVAVHNGAPQSLDGQTALQPVTRRPADDPPRVEVEHDRKVEPALRRPDVGDVGAPFPILLLSFEVLSEQVGRDWPGVFAVCGPLEPPFLTGHEAILPHQPGRSMAPDPVAVVDEIPMHPRATIGAIRQGEGRADMCKVDHVLPLTLAGRAVAPGVALPFNLRRDAFGGEWAKLGG